MFLNGEKSSTTANQPPAAYLHVLLFNEQFVFDNVNSYVQRVGTANTVTNIARSVPVRKNGYAYVYFSNESESAVWFDNLQLAHQRGAILEETHYYPFGLTMSGISYKAVGGLENRRKFNDGTELNTDLDLNWYETDYRNYDPQIGRFTQLDVLGELDYNISPYVFASNNPILRNDPLGLKDTAINESNPNVLQEVVVTTSKNKSVGQPGLAESLIPIWGSGRAAVDDFQNGRWGWGIFNTVMAISDVFLVKSAITGAGKLIAKVIYKTAAEEIVKTNTQRITLATIRSMTRETLMEQVTNPKLKSLVDQLYRPGAKIGSGSTADMIRIVGDAGHVEKGINRMNGLNNLINSGQLSEHDLDIAVQLRDDIIHALSTVK